MEMESSMPPGFRFHPTEEELVGYYLNRKINSLKIDLDVIIDLDLYKMEPWDIQARCSLGYDEQNEWYFFSHKDRKYPTGTRTNRATAAGFWKATGRDKAVLSKSRIIGMRKTLVFYRGRAPNGAKTDWIIHEYRLQTSQVGPPQEEGWVVCRAFKKPSPNQRQGFEAWNHQPYHINNNMTQNVNRPPSISQTKMSNTPSTHNNMVHQDQSPSFHNTTFLDHNNQFIDQLPQLDSPSTLSTTKETTQTQIDVVGNRSDLFDDQEIRNYNINNAQYNVEWKNLDNILPSHVISDTTSFPIIPNLPQSYVLDTENQVSQFLDSYFPDP